MYRFVPAVFSFLLAGCASYAVAQSMITLPMPVPEMPSQDGPKDRPYPVGTSVPVPGRVGVIDPSELEWSRDGRAHVRVEWPGVDSFRLQLLAEGSWHEATRVRVLDAAGEPLHIDTWAPAERPRWWSATNDDCCMVIEIAGRPGDGAVLRIVAADALGLAR